MSIDLAIVKAFEILKEHKVRFVVEDDQMYVVTFQPNGGLKRAGNLLGAWIKGKTEDGRDASAHYNIYTQKDGSLGILTLS